MDVGGLISGGAAILSNSFPSNRIISLAPKDSDINVVHHLIFVITVSLYHSFA